MPSTLDWTAFARLPGDPNRNWEIFCYGLVDWNYRRFGILSGQRQQPGVEFHLKLTAVGPLGDPGRWWGWQCKWYGHPQPRSLGKSRRDDIEDSIRKTERHLPDLTDWVLWLPDKPSADDFDWFHALGSSMSLHLWHGEDVETRIGGDAAVLRSTFFGELVLTPQALAEALEGSLGPLRRRWDPAVHVSVAVERELRRALVEPSSWNRFRDHGNRMLLRCADIEALLGTMAADDRASSTELIADLRGLATRLIAIADGADDGDPAAAVRGCRAQIDLALPAWTLRQLGTRLRGRRHPAALWVAAAEADRADAVQLMARGADNVSALAFAVVADAGQGKSYLSAQLAAATDTRPAGVLMLGIDLAAGHSLDHLARRVPALGVSTFRDLVAAVDAAGAREGRRLPIVIDGLNESERPTGWETILAQAKPVLERFPNALLVVTLRRSIADDVLPEYMRRLDLPGFEQAVEVAVEKYFTHYKINPGGVRVPFRQFAHPLFLRLYCEAANPTREHVVGPESLPSSTVGVYRRYRDVAADRLRRQLSLSPGYVEEALDNVAMAMWEAGTRSLPFSRVKTIVGDDAKEWDTSLARALEEEGLLWRSSAEQRGEERSALLFDGFAGFLIADALARRDPAGSAVESIRSRAWDAKLFGLRNDGGTMPHELASDIRFAMLDALPRHAGRHLWQEAPEDWLGYAIEGLLWIAPELLDVACIGQLEQRLHDIEPPRSYYERFHPYDRLNELADAEGHPFNADFTSRVLASYSVSGRDRLWSEWLRERRESILSDLSITERQLRNGELSDETARLLATWTAWQLTSTVAPIRDLASRWLYWYGRSHPARLFDLTLNAAPLNDPYVLERLAGASYGVVMAAYGERAAIDRPLGAYLEGVQDCFTGESASAPTTNHVVRGHLANTVELAKLGFPDSVPEKLTAGSIPFASPPPLPPIPDGTSDADSVDVTLHMDFVNYTMGRVFEDRRNYQSDHSRHNELVAAVRARIRDLGWDSDTFGEIDKMISEDRFRPGSRRPPGTERYGKKYGWIAFHEGLGRLVAEDSAGLKYLERLPESGPDMSFPELPAASAEQPDVEFFDEKLEEGWVRSGVVVTPESLMPLVDVDGRAMITVDAHVSAEDPGTGRRLWMRVRVLLVDTPDVEGVVSALNDTEYLGNALLFDPADHYLFAGEIPWIPSFGRDVDYVRELWGATAARTFEVEELIHDYSFEGNTGEWIESASPTSIAAASIWSVLGLRLKPQTFDGIDEAGQCMTAVRAVTVRAERSNVLYIDEAALRTYASQRGKTLVRVAFGEREINATWDNLPDWYERARHERAGEWRIFELV